MEQKTHENEIAEMLDVNALQKGDTIPAKQIEDWTGTERGTPEYAFKTLAIVTYLDSQKPDCSIAIRKGAVRILTDAEAVNYQDSRFESGIRALKRSERKYRKIDTSNFSGNEKEEYKAKHLLQSRILQAVKREQKQISNED